MTAVILLNGEKNLTVDLYLVFRKVSALSRVDLPAPLAPMMATNSPGLMYPETVIILTGTVYLEM